MKKLLCAFLVFSLVFSIFACSPYTKDDVDYAYSQGYHAGYEAAEAAIPTPSPTPKPTTRPTVPFPSSGTVEYSTSKECVAPFEITAASSYEYTIIKVVPVGSEWPVATVYLRSGKTVEFDMPLGKYYIYCAEGDEYYGEQSLFDSVGSYSIMDETFEFTMDEYGYNGYTLTLYTVANGNLDSSDVSFANFPR